MTANRKAKQAVRQRMADTGEKYTEARRRNITQIIQSELDAGTSSVEAITSNALKAALASDDPFQVLYAPFRMGLEQMLTAEFDRDLVPSWTTKDGQVRSL